MQRENNRTKLLTRRAVLLGGAQVALLAHLGRAHVLPPGHAGRPLCHAGRREPHQHPPGGAAARPHRRPLRRAARRQSAHIPRRAGGGAGRRHSRDARCGRDPHPAQRCRPPPRAARRPAQAQLRAGHRPREFELGRDGAHRGQHAGAAGRLDRAGPDALLPASAMPARTCWAMSPPSRKGAHTATIRCSSCPISASARTASRSLRSRAARQRRHQRGRGQRLWPRGARAGARGRHRRPGDRAQPRHGAAGSGGASAAPTSSAPPACCSTLDRRGAGAGLERRATTRPPSPRA